jgi:uncharacterized DUF497 family protein
MYVAAVTDMRFAWDEMKSRLNLPNHKVSFDTASLVFEDPHSISRFDRVKEGEERWQTLALRPALPCSLLLMPITSKAARK